MVDCWVDLQVSVISKITHSSVRWNRLILQRSINCWFLRQLLLPEAPPDLPPPVFAQNYHQAQSTVLSVGICSDLIEVSIANFWGSYYRPTEQILPDILPPDFARNYHHAQPTVLSVGIGSYTTKVSIDDWWDIYYQQNPPSISPPLFLRGIIFSQNLQLFIL